MRAPDFWRHDGALAHALTPLSWGFRGLGALRRRLVVERRVRVPVVCVGNLSVGGTSKTPVAIAIAGRLAAAGRAVHLLGRGYGGRARGPLRVDPGRHDARGVGDEALLLARAGPTWVGRDRAAAATRAVAAGAEVLVMDDGLQYPGLAKDLALVVIDGAVGFANRRVVPAGPLREPVARGLDRADAAVVVGVDRAGVGASCAARGLPVLAARLVPVNAHCFAGRAVLAFAGIGRPEKFFATLEDAGARVRSVYPFPDHHAYDADEIMSLVEEAAALGAAPVTTEKDLVRLPAEARAMVETLAVRLAWDDADALDRLLAGYLGVGR